MTSPVELVLGRLEHPRQSGRDRWRAACPSCGGRNRSTLSVAAGDNGCVLVRCWKGGCEPEQIAHALGLELDELFPPRDAASTAASRRRRLISDRQALDVLAAEADLVFVCASDMGRGVKLDQATRHRCMQAAARIGMLRDEVRS